MPISKTEANQLYEPQPGIDFPDPKAVEALLQRVDNQIVLTRKKSKTAPVEVSLTLEEYNNTQLRNHFCKTYDALGWVTGWTYDDRNGPGEEGYDYYTAVLK